MFKYVKNPEGKKLIYQNNAMFPKVPNYFCNSIFALSRENLIYIIEIPISNFWD